MPEEKSNTPEQQDSAIVKTNNLDEEGAGKKKLPVNHRAGWKADVSRRRFNVFYSNIFTLVGLLGFIPVIGWIIELISDILAVIVLAYG